MIQVYIAAPVTALRIGLRALLEGEADIQIAGEATSLAEAAPALAGGGVLVWCPADESLPELASPLAGAEFSLLYLGDSASLAAAISQKPWHAWGWLPVEASPEELASAVRALHEGLAAVEPALLRQLVSGQTGVRAEKVEPAEALTQREMEILQLLAQGLANKQMAARLGISTHTVKFHISSIYAKLGAASRTEAVRLGLQGGLVVL